MHIDELIYKLEELRSRYEDLHVYIWDLDVGWDKPWIEIVEKDSFILKSSQPKEDIWVGIR